MANQSTFNCGGPVFITNVFTTAPQNYPQDVGSIYRAQAAQLGPDNMDNMNTGDYYTDAQPSAAFMPQRVPWDDNQDASCKCGTRQELTSQHADMAWAPVEPVEVPRSTRFANGTQGVDHDESCDMALTPIASEFDLQTPSWESFDLTRSPWRAETPLADTPMRVFEASLPMGDPAEAAAQVNLQEEVCTDAQNPVPTPDTEIARLDAEFPTYPEQDFRVLNEDVMWVTPSTPGGDMPTPRQEQDYAGLTPGWRWEAPDTPGATEQAPSSPCGSLAFDREAFSAALQDAITGMDMGDDSFSPSPFH